MKAPKRRIDNVITRLTDSVHLLQVHTTVIPPTLYLFIYRIRAPSRDLSNLHIFLLLKRRCLHRCQVIVYSSVRSASGLVNKLTDGTHMMYRKPVMVRPKPLLAITYTIFYFLGLRLKRLPALFVPCAVAPYVTETMFNSCFLFLLKSLPALFCPFRARASTTCHIHTFQHYESVHARNEYMPAVFVFPAETVAGSFYVWPLLLALHSNPPFRSQT